MPQAVFVMNFICLDSFATNSSKIEFFKKVLALLVKTIASVKLFIPQKSCYLICNHGRNSF